MVDTIARPAPPHARSAPVVPPARRDVQGIRAFAVVAVIANHLLGWPSGGFVGVDIFFVISGFLITGLLLREYEQTGHISFRKFYARRARRILPAASLVLGSTLVAAFFVFNRPRFLATVWDAVSSAFFAANWRFAVTGTDYFQADGPVSPLRHFWSLAVEEQFYLVWPWLMLALFAIFLRPSSGSRTTRVVAGLGILAIVTGSYAWSLHQTVSGPTVAYFSTLTRAWELAVGAALAVGATVCRRIPDLIRPLLAWAGLIGMVVSLFVVSESAGFPAPGAVLPVASTAVLLAAGTGGGGQRWLAPLTNPVANYLGDISYSLYLWHFPVIILVGSVVEIRGVVVPVVVGAAVLALSVYSYHLVEDPIRRRRLHLGRRPKPGDTVSGRYRYVALSLLGVVCLSLCAAALRPAPAPVAVPYLTSSSTSPTTSKAKVTYGPEVTDLQQEITTALTKTSWPKLDPSMDEVLQDDRYPSGVAECGGDHPPAVEKCIFGPTDASHTAVVLGDSVSMKWVAALLKVYDGSDWNIKVLSRFGCPFTDLTKTFTDGQGDDCTARKQQALDQVAESEPDLVFISNTGVLPVVASTGRQATGRQWGEGLRTYVTALRKHSKVVVLSPPPAGADVRDCYTPSSRPPECVTKINQEWYAIRTAESRAAKRAGASYIDTSSLFCSGEGFCPSFVAKVPVKRDLTHVTFEYDEKIAIALREMLQSKRVQTT